MPDPSSFVVNSISGVDYDKKRQPLSIIIGREQPFCLKMVAGQTIDTMGPQEMVLIFPVIKGWAEKLS